MMAKTQTTKKRKTPDPIDNEHSSKKKFIKRKQLPFLIHWKDVTSGDTYKVGDTKGFNGKTFISVTPPHTVTKLNGIRILPSPVEFIKFG